ncbi:MAG: hypothetical protein Q4F84_08135, partial [Fibrobacter sp.]|nr:hypothetical protein [Fibrobacter sp.]
IPEIFLVILTFNFGCAGQTKNNENPKIMKTFDIKTFEKNKISKDGNKSYQVEYRQGEDVISLIESADNDNYVETISKKSKNFIIKNIYRKNNYTLKASQEYLINVPIGPYKEYDEKGNVINEIHNEPTYQFSVMELVSKVKNVFAIDLTEKKDKLMIGIQQDGTLPYYFVRYPLNDNLNSYKFIKINANTGEIISENIAHDIE